VGVSGEFGWYSPETPIFATAQTGLLVPCGYSGLRRDGHNVSSNIVGYASRTAWKLEPDHGTRCVPYRWDINFQLLSQTGVQASPKVPTFGACIHVVVSNRNWRDAGNCPVGSKRPIYGRYFSCLSWTVRNIG
jgi:hypothetical protein